ncbi:MAG: ParA family protein [Rhodospirillaceae bacterium]|jgi:chromosome partitioning protein|nr:ParA family protein [Rhodospirillaceae bacterium]MBT5373725.1 ParA family protein [Rhodospirillaceae bacterium]MBT5658854.1 ParA family protein [Rhodospirillaceae bacterium]MBT5751726.1 ParA family protein [Rhodospirillaceae bacterium]
MTQIIAIVNNKGGVGKTTTAINLATAMASTGKEVLIIDLDPQGNASTGLGVDPAARKNSSYDLLIREASLEEVTAVTPIPGLSVVPSNMDLSGAEIELVDFDNREYRLKVALEKASMTYDYVLIDCPPALGFLTVNALTAANRVLVPLQCEFYALEGLSHLLRIVNRVKRGLNPHLDLQGIVLTMYDKRNNLCDQVAEDVREHLGEKVYETVIPRNVRVSEAPSHGKPVLLYDHRCAGSRAYMHLAGEFMRREKVIRYPDGGFEGAVL